MMQKIKSNTIAPVDDHSTEIPSPPLLVWLILLAMLALTAGVWNQARKSVAESAEIVFQQHVDRTTSAVQERMYQYETILRGGIGLFKSSDHVSRKEWQSYVASLALSERAPGIQGMSFAKHIQPADLGRHIRQIRAEGFADYTVNPPGPRPEYTSITYIEPFDTRNKRAFGFDMYTEPTRYKAMARARDSGTAAISGMVKLKQETDADIQAGVVMYLPLYKKNAKLDSAEQRAQALLGYVSAAFRMNDLMAGILGNDKHLAEIDLEIYDGETVSSATLMYDADNIMHGNNEKNLRLFNVVQPISIVGQVWTVSITSTPLFEARIDSTKPMIIFMAGIIISLLFFAVAWSLSINRTRAQQLAERMTDELREKNHLLDSIVDNIPSMIFLKHASDLRFELLNRAGEVLLGQGRNELIGRNDYDFFPKEQADFFTQKDREVLGQNEVVDIPEELIDTPHGSRVLHTKKLVLKDSQGQPQYLLGISEDITERKESETKLLNAMNEAKAANAAKSAFLSNMSHEIRTPMNSIIGMSHLARKTHLNAKQHDYLTKIDYSAQHLLQLINNILDFSRNESHTVELESVNFELGAVFANISSQLSHSAASKNLRLNFDPDQSLSVPLRGDQLRLAQVLLNYASNAIKFTAQGEIIIRARMIEEGVNDFLIRFEVQDSGIGLSPEGIAKLFQPFHQAQASTTRQYGGTGLGLAISKQLAELMGGTVGVDSQPDQGSTFWFTARLAKGGKLLASTQSAPLNLEVLKGIAILLVEDNIFNQQVAVEMLSDVVASVSVANNGQEAIDMLLKQRFDCVLMDVQMPVMDGLEATRQIRSNPALAGTHIIAMTANARQEDQDQCFAAGMNDYMTKPIFADKLYAVIAEHMLAGQPSNIKAAQDLPKHGEPYSIDLDRRTGFPPGGQEPLRGNPTSAEAEAEASRTEARPTGNQSMGTTSAANQPALIDLSVLEKMLGSDPAKIHKFTLKFLNSAQQGLDEIEEVLRQEDMAALAALGHRNKSPAKIVGATAYADLCQSLEQFKSGGDIAQARQIVAQMSLLLGRIAEQINKER